MSVHQESYQRETVSHSIRDFAFLSEKPKQQQPK